ncbi:uncharacterized [Tachysurus ichikawai]
MRLVCLYHVAPETHTKRKLQQYVLFGYRFVVSTRIPRRKAHGRFSLKSHRWSVHTGSSTRYTEKITGSSTWRCPRESADSGTRDWPRGARAGHHLFRENDWDSNKDARRGIMPKRGQYTETVLQAFCPYKPPPCFFFPLVVVMEDAACCFSPHETQHLFV